VVVAPKGLQNPDRAAGLSSRGFDTLSLRQTCERALLPRFQIVHARLIPVGGFTFWANSGFTHCALARHPFVLAPVTTIPLLPDGDQSHEVTVPR
jgi:hypothetical protein